MAARTLVYRTGILGLLRELQYTHSQASAEPLAATYVPIFQALLDEWKAVLNEEIAILGELSKARAAAVMVDKRLDVFAGRASRQVDESTDGATRRQIKTALFKNKSFSKFRRPVLSGQLRAMTDWSDTLSKCGVPALVAMAAEADKLVAEGKAAEAQLHKAEKKNRDFRDVGMRKQFIDKVNAARKDAYGGLSKLPFENPALSQDFADDFFSVEPPKEEEETIDEVKTAIEALEAELAARRVQLKELEDEAIAAANAEKEREQEDQDADVMEAQANELLKKVAAIKAKRKK
jgi:hypothetical protein